MTDAEIKDAILRTAIGNKDKYFDSIKLSANTFKGLVDKEIINYLIEEICEKGDLAQYITLS